MKYFKLFFLLYIMSGLMSSCQKDAVNVKIPEAKILLTVHAYISPQDSILFIYVTESTPVFGKKKVSNGESLMGANVKLIHKQDTFNVLYNQVFLCYTIDTNQIKILSGETYHLYVKYQDKIVTSSCTVPKQLNFDITIDKLLTQYQKDPFSGDSNLFYRISSSFTDVPNEKNYYRVFSNLREDFWGYLYDNNGNVVDSVSNQGKNMAYYETNEGDLISDIDKDGSKFIQNGTVYGNEGNVNIYSKEMEFGIMHIDEHYYKYHRTAQTQLNNQGNPFSEPTLIYSNIEGGLGVFAAYQYRSFRKKL